MFPRDQAFSKDSNLFSTAIKKCPENSALDGKVARVNLKPLPYNAEMANYDEKHSNSTQANDNLK